MRTPRLPERYFIRIFETFQTYVRNNLKNYNYGKYFKKPALYYRPEPKKQFA